MPTSAVLGATKKKNLQRAWATPIPVEVSSAIRGEGTWVTPIPTEVSSTTTGKRTYEGHGPMCIFEFAACLSTLGRSRPWANQCL